MNQQGVILLCLILLAVGLPSIGAGWLGKHLIDGLGRYPSKAPVIQMSIFIKLIVLEVVSFTLLLGVFKILSAPMDTEEEKNLMEKVHLQRSVVIWNSVC